MFSLIYIDEGRDVYKTTNRVVNFTEAVATLVSNEPELKHSNYYCGVTNRTYSLLGDQ